MPNEPKLEVFKFALNPIKGNKTTFKDFFSSKLYVGTANVPSDKKVIYKDYFESFNNILSLQGFYKDKKGTKAITSFTSADGNTPITLMSEKNVICGVITGGTYGKKRIAADVDDKAKSETIDKKKVIGTQFFFYLYAPLDFHWGAFFIQSYGLQENIKSPFVDLIAEYFQIPQVYSKPNIEAFLPEETIKEIQNGAVVNSYDFTTHELISVPSDDPMVLHTEEFTIKVQIIPKSKDTNLSKAQNVFSHIKLKSFFGQEKVTKKLEEFQDSKMVAENKSTKNKGRLFDVTSGLKVRPIIHLQDINLNEDNIPDFEAIKVFCHELLEPVKKELRGENKINER
jgi:hypothetical protein